MPGQQTDEEELADVAHDRELQRLLFEGGLAGIIVPTAYGGQGLTPEHARVLNEVMAGRQYPDRLQVPTFTPCMAVLLDFGTEEQKQDHVPAILSGQEIWMQMLSEPSGGSDVAGAQTSAVRDGDEWVLNGSKIWTTGAWWADWALCLVRTNPDVPKHRGLSVFMVPFEDARDRDAPHRDAERLEGVLSGVPHRRPHPRQLPHRQRRRRLDGRHPMDVLRAFLPFVALHAPPGRFRDLRTRSVAPAPSSTWPSGSDGVTIRRPESSSGRRTRSRWHRRS